MKIGIGTTLPKKEYAGNLRGLKTKSTKDNKIVFSYNSDQTTIAKDKNKLIKELYDDGCDYIFIFDDDCFPIKEGWEQFFIDASIHTGCQHFIVGNDEHLNMIGEDNGLTYFQKGTGCMLFLTRKVVDEVGYMNNKYGKYGYEHAAYSYRIHRAGLTPSWYTSVDGWEEYIYSWDLQKQYADKHKFVKVQQFTDEEKNKYITENEYHYRKERRSIKNYYDYEQLVTEKKLKIGYIALQESMGGSSYYRIQGVLPLIKHDLLELTDLSDKNWTTWQVLNGLDMLVFHRPFTADHFAVIEQARAMGIWVIADYDDDVLNVPDHHPVYELYNENKANAINCVKSADEVWASTRSILETFYNFNHNIHVIPNAHNDYLFPVELKKPFNWEVSKLVYRGGNTHRLDLYHVKKDLQAMATENKEWQFIFIGIIDNQEFFDDMRTNTNVYLTSKMPFMQYMTHLMTINAPAMIAPLDNHKLNRAKSNISWLEGTYAGSAFFGNKLLPEFNFPFILPFSLAGKAIKDKHIATLKKSNEESWAYIKENLLLSKINLLRLDRLLAK